MRWGRFIRDFFVRISDVSVAKVPGSVLVMTIVLHSPITKIECRNS